MLYRAVMCWCHSTVCWCVVLCGVVMCCMMSCCTCWLQCFTWWPECVVWCHVICADNNVLHDDTVCCVVLQYVVWRHAMLSCAVMHCMMTSCVVLCCNVFMMTCHAVIVLYCNVLCDMVCSNCGCVVLCCTMTCCAMMQVVLCWMMLYCVVPYSYIEVYLASVRLLKVLRWVRHLLLLRLNDVPEFLLSLFIQILVYWSFFVNSLATILLLATEWTLKMQYHFKRNCPQGKTHVDIL